MPATAVDRIELVPSDRGRIRAVLATLEARWDRLTPVQQRHALGLLSELSAAARAREVRAIAEEVPAPTG